MILFVLIAALIIALILLGTLTEKEKEVVQQWENKKRIPMRS